MLVFVFWKQWSWESEAPLWVEAKRYFLKKGGQQQIDFPWYYEWAKVVWALYKDMPLVCIRWSCSFWAHSRQAWKMYTSQLCMSNPLEEWGSEFGKGSSGLSCVAWWHQEKLNNSQWMDWCIPCDIFSGLDQCFKQLRPDHYLISKWSSGSIGLKCWIAWNVQWGVGEPLI